MVPIGSDSYVVREYVQLKDRTSPVSSASSTHRVGTVLEVFNERKSTRKNVAWEPPSQEASKKMRAFEDIPTEVLET